LCFACHLSAHRKVHYSTGKNGLYLDVPHYKELQTKNAN
jgi:hypothetical protein